MEIPPIEEKIPEIEDFEFYRRMLNGISDEDKKIFEDSLKNFQHAKEEKRYDEMNKYQRIMDEIVEKNLPTSVYKMEYYKLRLRKFEEDDINFGTLSDGIPRLVNGERKEFLQSKILGFKVQNDREVDKLMSEIETKVLPADNNKLKENPIKKLMKRFTKRENNPNVDELQIPKVDVKNVTDESRTYEPQALKSDYENLTDEPIIDEIEEIPEYIDNSTDKKEIDEQETLKPKVKLSEQHVLSAQEKLTKLREKFKENPPKTLLGKKIAITKLNRLKANIDRAIIKNNLKILSERGLYSKYESYAETLNVLEEQIANLEADTKRMETEVKRLDNLDPLSKKSIFAKDNKRVRKNMPKGYKANVGEKDGEEDKRLELNKAVQENKKLIDDKKALITELHKTYEIQKAKEKKNLKKDLVVVKPNIFKKIGKFLKEKRQQFNEWRVRKNGESQLKLEEMVKESEGSTKRKMMFEDLSSGYTQEEQNTFARETNELIKENKNKDELSEKELGNDNK